jgi:hypothetical protein
VSPELSKQFAASAPQRWLARAVMLAMAGMVCAGEPQVSTDSPVLTSIGEVLRLPAGERQRSYPVDIRAIVTESSVLRYMGVEYPNLFIQDPTGGIRVSLGSRRPAARQGDRIEIRGRRAVEGGVPMIAEPTSRYWVACWVAYWVTMISRRRCSRLSATCCPAADPPNGSSCADRCATSTSSRIGPRSIYGWTTTRLSCCFPTVPPIASHPISAHFSAT